MKLRRVALLSLLAALLVAGMWISGGDAWAARRELKCEKEWATTFGSFEDLKKKYPKRETNETAKKLQELTHGSAFDLTSSVRMSRTHFPSLPPEKGSQAILDYLSAENTKEEASIDLPPENVARFFDENRTQLAAIESTLAASPPPEWSLDISRSENESPLPNLLGHMRLQRALTAHALAAAQAGRDDLAARALEASWNLNESLRSRPETTSLLIAMAVARLEAGVLRKMNVGERPWSPRVAGMDFRPALLEALVLDSGPSRSKLGWRNAWASGKGSTWYRRVRDFLAGPMDRVAIVEDFSLMREELVQLRGAPLLDHFPPASTPKVLDPAHIITTISMPTIQNSFLRADRLVVDAELTGKILEVKRLRRENGMRWPASISGIEVSRFPGASWRYEVSPDSRQMSIAFSREWTSPYGQGGLKPLPLSFSSN